ncbi:hypothetical protein [Micromonospora aurantiaca (nom. illeg.)]|uniref:hypothetical protein n=1 Tax=Micromonospora aurantiaca (nom. illeg.) TaxID=47850 RepID=UPI003F4A3D38
MRVAGTGPAGEEPVISTLYLRQRAAKIVRYNAGPTWTRGQRLVAAAVVAALLLLICAATAYATAEVTRYSVGSGLVDQAAAVLLAGLTLAALLGHLVIVPALARRADRRRAERRRPAPSSGGHAEARATGSAASGPPLDRPLESGVDERAHLLGRLGP